jgi:hypothetical protein
MLWLGDLLGVAQILFEFGFSDRDLGRRLKIDVVGQRILFFETRQGESAQRVVEFDLGTAALPLAIQHGRGLLEAVQHQASALVVNAIVGQSFKDLLERDLHRVHVFHDRQLDTAGFTAAAGLGHLQATGTSVEVKVTEFLVTKCGRVAVDTIFFEMVTGG